MSHARIAICIPSYDSLKFHHVVALQRLIIKPPPIMLLRTHGVDIVTARNQLTKDALSNSDVTHLLFIDDDMVPPPGAVEALLRHDKAIVGGLCHNRRGPSYHPTLCKLFSPSLALASGAMGFWYDHPRGELLEVDATGGAFLLVKREVFDDISRTTKEDWWDPIDGLSEDFSFCKRARMNGHKVHVDPEVDVGHVAEVVLTRETAKKLRTLEWAAWVPGEVAQREGNAAAPVASIVIPTYNQRLDYLHAAIYSALAQTVPVEVVVVDDGSDVPVNVDSFKARNLKLVRHEKNMGISAALNTGIGYMTTEMFCWLSSDDLLDPRKVEMQLAVMQSTGALASFHDYSVVDPVANSYPKYAVGPTFKSLDDQRHALAESCCINGSTVMIDNEALAMVALRTSADVNGRRTTTFFDETLRYGQDWDLWCRLSAAGIKWHHVEEQLGIRREDGNLTSQIEADPTKRHVRDAEDALIRDRYKVR